MNATNTGHTSTSTSMNSPRPRFGNVVSWRAESIGSVSSTGSTREQVDAGATVQVP